MKKVWGLWKRSVWWHSTETSKWLQKHLSFCLSFYFFHLIHSLIQVWNFSLLSPFLPSLLVVVQLLSCVPLCNTMDCSTPDFLVLHYLPEFAQTRFHWVGDAIQPSHSLSPSSLPALNLSQHQDLFQWVGSLHHVASASASVLPMNIQAWFPSRFIGLISLLSKGLWRVFSSTTVQKHQFFGTQISL